MANLTYPEYADGTGFKIPDVRSPKEDKRLKEIQDRQLETAKDFRNNIPQFSEMAYNDYSKGARQNLASNIAKTRASYNSRGLLKSGVRQGAELGERGASAVDLYSKRAEINKGLLGLADSLDANAFNTAGNRAGLGSGLGGVALSGLQTGVDQDISNLQNQSTLYGGIASGLGRLGGQLAYNRRVGT